MGRSPPRKLSPSSSPSPLQLGLASASRAAPPRLPCRDANETLCGDGGPATAARLLRPAGGRERPRRWLAHRRHGQQRDPARGWRPGSSARWQGSARPATPATAARPRGPAEGARRRLGRSRWRGADRGRRQRRDPPGIGQGGHHDGRGRGSRCPAGALDHAGLRAQRSAVQSAGRRRAARRRLPDRRHRRQRRRVGHARRAAQRGGRQSARPATRRRRPRAGGRAESADPRRADARTAAS